jgi:hypothetical protein
MPARSRRLASRGGRAVFMRGALLPPGERT